MPAYADAYPYDYAFVDPLYAGAGATTRTRSIPSTSPADYLTSGVRTSAIGPTPIADPPVVPEVIDQARAGAEAINAGVRAALNPIRDLIRTTPAEEEDTLSYGPMLLGGASYRFTIRRLSGERHFGWRLEVQPAAGGGPFALAAGSLIRVGDAPRRGRGTLGVDLDAMSAADPTVAGKGKLLIGFVHAGSGDGANDAKVLHVSLRDYTPDPATVAAMNGEAFAWRRGTSANQARIVTRVNVASTATAAEELIAIKLRWQKDVGVRADAAATGGDIPDGSGAALDHLRRRDVERRRLPARPRRRRPARSRSGGVRSARRNARHARRADRRPGRACSARGSRCCALSAGSRRRRCRSACEAARPAAPP